MSTAAAGGYEGGGGGKFRKRPFRKQATPYDRPVSALRNPVEGGKKNGWISKIVDPASRLITQSAHRFFSSLFRKSLPALETVPEVHNCYIAEADSKPSNESSEAVSANPFAVREPVFNGHDNLNKSSDNNGIGELELILKQKTFTRAEIERLTELLRSRTVDMSAEDEKKRSEPSTSQPVVDNHKVELINVPVQENGLDSRRLLGEALVPAVSSSVLEEKIAPPAELAKAYMGNRLSKVSPSTVDLRSLREELPLLGNAPFPRKSSGKSAIPRSSVRFAGVPGVPENGHQTPRSRGRSAIYTMACTPYSRIHPPAMGIGNTDDWCAGPSTSPWTAENNTVSIGKQVSKRRSLVLDNDIGSVGPIRRIRQKTNLMSPKSIGLLASETPIHTPGTIGSGVAQGSVSLSHKPLLLEEPRQNIPKMRIAEDGENRVPGTSFAFVPSQSSEMAQKILQQLDKLVPSPKDKSSELKLAIAREKSPAKLSLNMLHGQAFQSVEEVDSSKLRNNVQGVGTFDAVGGTPLPAIQDSASQKKDKVEENGWLKLAASGNKLAPEMNDTGRTTLKKDTIPNYRTADLAISNLVMTSPRKKHAFQMGAQDSLELDDCYSTKSLHTAYENEKVDNATVEENKAVAAEIVTVEKPSVSEIKTPASLTLNKSSGTGAYDGHGVNEKNPVFAAPVTPLSSTVAQPATLHQSPPLFGNVVPTKGPTAALVFNFGSKGTDNAPPPFTFSSISNFSESSGLKFDTQRSSSPATFAATATEMMTTAAKLDTGGKENALKVGDLFRKPDNSTFLSVSTSTTQSIFPFNNSTNNSNLSNGSIEPSTMLSSVSASPSVPVSIISDGVSCRSSPTTTAITTPSSLSPSAATLAFSSVPKFQFGSGNTAAVAPSSSMSQPSTSGAEQKVETTLPFGSLSPPFGATSSALTNTGNGIFGFSSGAPANTSNSSSSDNHPRSNPFGTANGPVFGSQTESRTGTSPFTQSIPSQLGSSAPLPIFGLSSYSTFSSGSSTFGSSTPASELFGSGSCIGQNSSTTFSMGANPFSAASGTAGSFSSSSQPASSLFSPAFSSASSPASGFSFGGSSTAGAAIGTVSSPATGFSFEGSSTAGADTVSTSPVTGFSFGGSLTSGAVTGRAPMAFGSGIGASSGSFFPFASASAAASSDSLASSQPMFGAINPSITFGSPSPVNDQMNMEDSMAEDTVQASTATVSTFGQPATTPSPGLMFNLAPFQFVAQQNPSTPQNSSPYQTSGNFDFAPGGSFSLGTADKSTRKFIRAKRDKARKK